MSDPLLPPPPPEHEPFGAPPEQPLGAYQQYGYGYGYGQGGQHAYAGFWRRFGASLTDAVIVALPTGLLTASLDVASGFFIRIAIAVVYYAALEGGPKGQTIGKMWLGIRVVDQDTGQPGIGPGRAIGRYFGRWLSGLPLGLGYLWMLWDQRKQTWHDKLVRSLVVRA